MERVAGSGGGGCLQLLDLELAHLQHGGHDPGGFRAILAGEELPEDVGDDLSREAELVGQPDALAGPAAPGRELLPVGVNLLLRLAVDDERERRTLSPWKRCPSSWNSTTMRP